MANLNELFQLIDSLDRTEKRYIITQGHRKSETGVTKLFRMISNKNTDRKMIRKDFEKLFTSVSFDMAKNQLFKKILKALKSYNNPENVETQLLELILDIKILFRKNLFSLCYKLIEKAKMKAIQHEKNLYLLLILQLELSFRNLQNFSNMSEKMLIKLQDQCNNALKQIQSLINHHNLYDVLYYKYLYSGMSLQVNLMADLNFLAISEMSLMSNPKYDNFESRSLHLQFQSVYCMLNKDFKHGVRLFYELDKLYAQNQNRWVDTPIHYVNFLKDTLQTLFQINKINEFDYFLKKLQEVKPDHNSTRYLIDLIRFEFEYYRLILSNNKEQISQNLKSISHISNLHLIYFSYHDFIKFCFLKSIHFYLCSDYKTALKLTHNALYEDKPLQSEIITYSLFIFRFVLLFELKKFDILESELCNFQKVSKKLGCKFQTVLISLNKMKDLSKCILDKQLFKNLNEFKEEIQPVYISKTESEFFQYFDLTKWIDSQISKSNSYRML